MARFPSCLDFALSDWYNKNEVNLALNFKLRTRLVYDKYTPGQK